MWFEPHLSGLIGGLMGGVVGIMCGAWGTVSGLYARKGKHKNIVLEQENDFLKKMIFLAKRVQWEKSLREKDTK